MTEITDVCFWYRVSRPLEPQMEDSSEDIPEPLSCGTHVNVDVSPAEHYSGAGEKAGEMSALPEDEDPFRRRLTETFERAVEAHRREAEALEELRLLLYVDRTAQDPETLDGLKEFAEHVASGKHPEGSIAADQFDTGQFVSRVRSRPEQ